MQFTKSEYCRLLVLIVVLFVSGVYSHNPASQKTNAPSRRIAYVIARNQIDPEFKYRRLISVLIPKDQFTKEGVLAIVDLIDRKFAKPAVIYLDIYTDVEDVPTQEDYEKGGISASERDAKLRGDYSVIVRIRKGKYGNRFMYFADGRFIDLTTE